MKSIKKSSLFFAVIYTLFLGTVLTACQSPPKLKQVASDAADKPINTQQASDELKKKYEK